MALIWFINRVRSAHISRCHSYVGRQSNDDEIAGARASVNTYDVESILSHKFIPTKSRTLGAVQIQVKWTGYETPTWEKISNNMSLRRNEQFVKYASALPDLVKFIPSYLQDTNS